MDYLILALLSAVSLTLYGFGRAFRDPTPAALAACVLIVMGVLVLHGGAGQSTIQTANTSTNASTFNNTSALLQTANTTTATTTTQSWRATTNEQLLIGMVYLGFGLYLILEVTLFFLQGAEEAFLRRWGRK